MYGFFRMMKPELVKSCLSVLTPELSHLSLTILRQLFDAGKAPRQAFVFPSDWTAVYVGCKYHFKLIICSCSSFRAPQYHAKGHKP